RSEKSLTQTAGRAARNINGRVIMYADKITDSMQRTINETNRRREKQLKYNMKNKITPQSIKKSLNQTLQAAKTYNKEEKPVIAADPVVAYMSEKALKKAIDKSTAEMKKFAKALNFKEAARIRDEILEMEKMLINKNHITHK
ncbi:MAG TPA: excinuclease ABC subunit B, partial [Bacteroidales bacterium]|nr:excinuclease ABC subunit B [Bacteroidales bacterium]